MRTDQPQYFPPPVRRKSVLGTCPTTCGQGYADPGMACSPAGTGLMASVCGAPRLSRMCAWVQATEYVFTNLDKTLMTNVADRDPRLWVHLLSSYVISFVVWRVSTAAERLPMPASREVWA